jgi:hypothetical protein
VIESRPIYIQLDQTGHALAHQPRFAGLFGGGPMALKRTRQAMAALPSSHEADIRFTNHDAELSLRLMDKTATLS